MPIAKSHRLYPASETSYHKRLRPGHDSAGLPARYPASFIMRDVTTIAANWPAHPSHYSPSLLEYALSSPHFPTVGPFSDGSMSLPTSPRTSLLHQSSPTSGRSASHSRQSPARQNRSVSPTVKVPPYSPIFMTHGWQRGSTFLSTGHPNLLTYEQLGHAAYTGGSTHARHCGYCASAQLLQSHDEVYRRLSYGDMSPPMRYVSMTHSNTHPQFNNLEMTPHCEECGMALTTSPGALSHESPPTRSFLRHKLMNCSSSSVPYSTWVR